MCLGRLAGMLLLQVCALGTLHRVVGHGQGKACTRYQIQDQPSKPFIPFWQLCFFKYSCVPGSPGWHARPAGTCTVHLVQELRDFVLVLCGLQEPRPASQVRDFIFQLGTVWASGAQAGKSGILQRRVCCGCGQSRSMDRFENQSCHGSCVGSRPHTPEENATGRICRALRSKQGSLQSPVSPAPAPRRYRA